MIHDAAPPDEPSTDVPGTTGEVGPDPDLAALLAAEQVANDYHPWRSER